MYSGANGRYKLQWNVNFIQIILLSNDVLRSRVCIRHEKELEASNLIMIFYNQYFIMMNLRNFFFLVFQAMAQKLNINL